MKIIKAKLPLLIFLLSSCSHNSIDSMDQFRTAVLASATSETQEFVAGKNSGKEDLLQYHERAKVEWIDSNGNVVKSYTHSERKLGLLSYVPVLSFFLPRKYENYEVIVTFNKAAIADVQSFYSTITLTSEAICHEAIFSCVIGAK